MIDTVVVTLSAPEFSADFELPLNEPLAELYYRLLRVLHKTYKDFCVFEGIVLEKNGAGMINQSATLADYGVHDGEILSIADAIKYSLDDMYS